MNIKNVLFLVNETKDDNLTVSKDVIKYLLDKKVKVYSTKMIADMLNVELYTESEHVDLAVVLGGDGTILNFAHNFQQLNLPYFGINLGRVGALAEGSLTNCYQKLDEIFKGNYYVEERNVINCKIYSGDNKLLSDDRAFNEVSVQKGNLFKMLLVNMKVNDHNKTSFYADGVLIATSTGSSAYNLSSGGPLLLPDAKNFVVTPMSPQLRTITSLVLNDTDKIEVDLKDSTLRESYEENKPVVFIDGATQYDIDGDSKIVITKSDRILKIIKINKEASLFEPIYKVALTSQKLFTPDE